MLTANRNLFLCPRTLGLKSESRKIRCVNSLIFPFPFILWAYCAYGRQRRCQEDHVNSPSRGLEETTMTPPHPIISHCLKQWIWPRTGLCGGCGRRTALRSLDLHASNDDTDDSFHSGSSMSSKDIKRGTVIQCGRHQQLSDGTKAPAAGPYCRARIAHFRLKRRTDCRGAARPETLICTKL